MDAHVAKSIVYDYFDRLVNQRDLTVCDEMLAADYLDHDAPADAPLGAEGTKAYITALWASYPDHHIYVEDMVAEEDKVAARIVWDGTNAELGERLTMMGILLIRLNDDGQLAERWSGYQAIL